MSRLQEATRRARKPGRIAVRALLGQQDTLPLKRAILIYGDAQCAFATLHEVAPDPRGGGAAPILLPGVCVTREAVADLLKKLTGAPQRRHLLPDRILCADSTLMAWWHPAARRPIFFNTGNKAFNAAMAGKSVLYPPLCFVAKARQLSVFALKEDARPTPETPLMRAPFYNLYQDGLMCAGNTRPPDALVPSEIPLWDRAFFDTNFTHSNVGEKITLYPGGHAALWKAMAKRSVKTFPCESLIPLQKTLQEVIEG